MNICLWFSVECLWSFTVNECRFEIHFEIVYFLAWIPMLSLLDTNPTHNNSLVDSHAHASLKLIKDSTNVRLWLMMFQTNNHVKCIYIVNIDSDTIKWNWHRSTTNIFFVFIFVCLLLRIVIIGDIEMKLNVCDECCWWYTNGNWFKFYKLNNNTSMQLHLTKKKAKIVSFLILLISLVCSA